MFVHSVEHFTIMSPFRHIESWIKICQSFGGLPFTLRVEGNKSVVEHNGFKFYSKFLLAVFLGAANPVLNFLILYIIFGKVDTDYILDVTGYSNLDTGTFTCVGGAGFLSSLAYFWFLNVADIAAIVSQFESYAQNFAQNIGEKSAKIIWQKCRFYACISCFSVIFYTLLMNEIYEVSIHEHGTWFWKTVYLASAVVCPLFGLVTPLLIGVGIFVQYLVMLLNEYIENWINELHFVDSKPSSCWDKSDKKVKALSLHLKDGIKLLDLKQNLNGTVAPLIFIHFAYCLSSSISSFYGETAIFFGQRTRLRYLTTASFHAHKFSALNLLYFACSVGQELEDNLGKAKEALEDHARFKLGSLPKDESTRLDWQILASRLAGGNGISPGNFFRVNRSCFLQSLGTAFTYLIVLMQFKVSE